MDTLLSSTEGAQTYFIAPLSDVSLPGVQYVSKRCCVQRRMFVNNNKALVNMPELNMGWDTAGVRQRIVRWLIQVSSSSHTPPVTMLTHRPANVYFQIQQTPLPWKLLRFL